MRRLSFPIIGRSLAHLPVNTPTIINVLRRYCCIKFQKKITKSNAAKLLVDEVEEIWNHSSLPIQRTNETI